MATPFPFGSGNVLTAAQMNAITTLPVSTKTASYTLTVADVGYRIVMNSASATTITVNTSIFGASDKVEILNIGAGVCTVTAGTCTVGTSGTLALVQNAGGTLTFISASASVFTASDVPSGLTLISTTAWSGVTVTLDNVFSSTYTHYKIICSATASTGAATAILTQLRVGGVTNATAASYNSARNGYNFTTGVINADVTTAATSWFLWRGAGAASVSGGFAGSMDISYPAVATQTWVAGTSVDGSYQASAGGYHTVTTAFDGIIFTNNAGGTVTGTVSIFGYTK